jgi:hypothetical protein
MLLYKIDGGETWKEKAPREYWQAVDLRGFSKNSEPHWWKFLWPLIKKHNPDLLAILRNESVSNAAKNKTARWSTFRRQFRQHLQLLAERRARGVR